MRNALPMNIGLLDAMGYGNLGDAAIQDAVIANIKQRLPDARIVGFSFFPDDTVARHGIPCYRITRHCKGNTSKPRKASGRRSIKPTLKLAFRGAPVLRAVAKAVADVMREGMFLARSYSVLRSLDILIISGGGQLDELWGGAWAHPCNLFKFSLLTKLAGRKLYFLDVGAERLPHRLSRFFAKSALRMADYVSFRDVHSQTVVQSLGVKGKTYVLADPAYALDAARCLNGNSRGPSRPTVGINPMGFCDPRVWPRKEQPLYEAYLEKMTRFSLWLLDQGYSLKLFSTSPGVDKQAVADLKGRVLSRYAPRDSNAGAAKSSGEVVEEARCGGVQELLREIGRCDFVLTSKYHGVIFSHLLRKPVIALSYQTKIDAAMQAMRLGDFCASIEYFEAEWLVGAFRSLVDGRETIEAQEGSAVAAFTEALRKQFDGLFAPCDGSL
jgi:polysaccharide pyruvyl transferase WcaK-like protein